MGVVYERRGVVLMVDVEIAAVRERAVALAAQAVEAGEPVAAREWMVVAERASLAVGAFWLSQQVRGGEPS